MRKVMVALFAVVTFFGFNFSFAQETPRTLYVLNGLGRTVSKMNLETLEISNDIVAVGNIPNKIFTREDKVYVVNSVPAGITVIDGLTDQIMNISLTEGSNPWSMAFIGNDQAYVTNLFTNSVTVVDLVTGDSLDTIPVGVAPEGILVVNDMAYVTNTGGFLNNYSPSTVSVIDIDSNLVTKTVNVATNPQELALAPDGNIHVVCTGNFADIGGKVYIIDPSGDADSSAAVVDSVIIGGSPNDIAITSAGIAYLADFGDAENGFLYSYNTATKEVFNDASNPIRVGKGAINLLYDLPTEQLYVNNFSDDAVQLLDPSNGAVLQTFPFGDGAQDMAILETSKPTVVENRDSLQPSNFTLFQNYPNPFNPETKIEFTVSSKSQVHIKIFNLKGQLIRTLVDNSYDVGRYSTIWNGQNDQGQIVPSGLYFYQMEAGRFRETRRLILLR